MSEKRLSNEEKAIKINESLSKLDAQRSTGLEQNQEIQETKAAAQTRERDRLVVKYGEDHPRVQKVDRQLSTNPRLFQANKEEIQRSRTISPGVVSNTWTVYGTVRDEKNNRLPDLTLSLYDQENKWVRDLGYACTDERGYYLLKVEDLKGALTKKYKDKPLFLKVSDKEKVILHTEEKPLYFEVGKTENREIVLEGDHCATPPDDGTPVDYLVEGTIYNANNEPMSGVIVKAVDLDPKGENPLGEDVTDKKGHYSISYKASDFIIGGYEITGPDIVLYLYDASGKLLYKTKNHNNSPRIAKIDVVVKDKRGK